MNILFVFYVPSGGVETLNRQRCIALKAHGINAHCLYYEKRRELVNQFETPTFITNEDEEIRRILSDGEYEAIVVTSDFQALPRFRGFGFKGKMIIEIQGYGPKSTARAALRNAIPVVTKYADAFLNPKTPHIVQLLDELYPSVPSFSFNNCFDTDKFRYRPLPVSSGPIIAWIGRIEDNKNWREFLKIGSLLIRRVNQNIQLQMYEDPSLSDPKERPIFERMIQRMSLGRNLTLHSNVPNSEMADHYSRIGDSEGFLCSTSKVEGAPYSILEAMSCKCPVLTTDSDGVRSSIVHNQTGKYYTLGRIDEAVEQAKDLMTNHQLRETIRENALEYVKTNFNPDLYCQNFISMLRQLGIDVKE